ncbi:hypothetical protein FQN54_006096 [Arachnomyces sp. PD_36]|nr:hypothetical protein FQN54_006096 [Arachnomyces sp. PD_36]
MDEHIDEDLVPMGGEEDLEILKATPLASFNAVIPTQDGTIIGKIDGKNAGIKINLRTFHFLEFLSRIEIHVDMRTQISHEPEYQAFVFLNSGNVKSIEMSQLSLANLNQRLSLLTTYEQPNSLKYDPDTQHEKIHAQGLVTQRVIPSVAIEMGFLRDLFTASGSFEFVVVELAVPIIMRQMTTAFAAELASPPLNRWYPDHP